jgi:hypothetical protein
VRLPDEMNDHFRVRVELDTENVVGSYARGEFDLCIVSVSNVARVNRVFEQAGVPYGPRLEPGSEASKEAMRKRRCDAGAGSAGKHAKVFGRKAAASKDLVVAKNAGVGSSKTIPSKTTPLKAAPSRDIPAKTAAVPKAGAPPKASATEEVVTPWCTVASSVAPTVPLQCFVVVATVKT